MRRMRHLKPREIQGCQVAYDFSKPDTLFDSTSGGANVVAGGSIARCEDISGNGRDIAQSTPSARPSLAAAGIGGLPAASVSGSQSLAFLAASPLLRSVSGSTIIFVGSLTSTGASRQALTVHTNTTASTRASFIVSSAGALTAGGRRLDLDSYGRANSTTASASGELLFASFEYSAARLTFFRNATQAAQNNAFGSAGLTSDTDSAGVSVGGAFGQFWFGLIGEASVYGVSMSDALARRVQASKMRKWRFSQ